MDKYYVPTIEEFHVGFEYEFYNDMFNIESYWSKEIVTNNFKLNDLGYGLNIINSKYIRVKYLDIDDINKLGWTAFGRDAWKETFEHLQEGCTFRLIDIENDDWELYYNNIELIEIFDWKSKCVFSGSIKNKSELKVLMKQLDIIT